MTSSPAQLVPVVCPDFDLPGFKHVVGQWLVPTGRPVRRGDRLVEILAGEALIEVASPEDGVLARRALQTDDAVAPGDVLAFLRCESS